MRLKKWVLEVIVLIMITGILRAMLYFNVLTLDMLVVCGIGLCLTKIMTRELFDGE